MISHLPRPRSLLLYALLFALCLTALDAKHPTHGRRMIRSLRHDPHLAPRQVNKRVAPSDTSVTPASTSGVDDPATTTNGGFLNSIATALDPNKQPSVSVPSISVPAVVPTTTLPLTTSVKPLTTVAKTTESSTPTVVQVTQTSTISSPTTSASASATATPDTSNSSGGGGLSKGTLIGIIVVASAVGAVAAIWTIIRKWKLSPSRRFEDKLNPIDFVDEYGQARDVPGGSTVAGPTSSGYDRATNLSRSGSNSSSEMLHKRENSWGSNSGSQRGVPMSETPHGRSVYPPPAQPWPPTMAQGQAPFQPNPLSHLPNPYDYAPTNMNAGGYSRF